MHWIIPIISNIFLTISTLIVFLIIYMKWATNYWERKNVPNMKKSSFFEKEKFMYEHFSYSYKINKSAGHDFYGVYIFARPLLILINPDLIKQVIIKDFHHFNDHGLYFNEKDDPLAANLINVSGEKWRKLRPKLTPTFTSGKMKLMFQMIIDCSNRLTKRIDQYANNKESIDIKEVLACFTTDIIGTCAFGLEFNSFEDDEAEFRKYGRKIFALSRLRMIKKMFLLLFPNVGKMFHIKLIPEDVSQFFLNAVKDAIKYREINNYKRNDFLQMLMELKKDNLNNEKPLNDLEIAAQCFVFFVAGFESSSTTMSFCLYELAKNQEIQEKVRDEINKTLIKNNDNLTYDTIMSMKYMTQVVDETLRKYPAAHSLIRKCTKEYVIPNTNIKIEKGTPLLVPVYALHNDPEYFPEPEKFDPERFNETNKKERHQCVYLPFGEGPRICIGMRFGLMQTKVGLTVLLKNYIFTISRKTVEPLVLDPISLVTTSKDSIYLDAIKVDE